MKKLISLRLVLVLSLGMLSGLTMAADKPAEAAQADAGVKVTFAGDSNVYYFDTLNQDLLAWACGEMPGAPTFTVLKDLALDPNDVFMDSRYMNIPVANADWYGGVRPNGNNKLPVIIDLGGHTLTHEGGSNLFFTSRWGMTVKNGTIIATGLSAGRSIFCLGNGNGSVANSSATSVYAPELVLDGVTCISNNGVVINHLYASKITANNCTLWSTEGTAIQVLMSDQADIGNATYYEGYAPSIALNNCVVGSGAKYAFSGVEEPGAKIISLLLKL